MCDNHDGQAGQSPDQLDLGGPGLGRRTFLTGLATTALGVGAGVLQVAPALANTSLGVAAGDMAAQAASTSQNGWPVLPSTDSRRDRGFQAGGELFVGGVREGEVSAILGFVAARFDRDVEALKNPGCWGWARRAIRNGTVWSNHASATAIDCNAPEHPLGARGTFTAAQIRQIQTILSFCEGTVRWGGDYSGRRDEMHFEINRRPGDAAIARVAARIGRLAGRAAGWPTLKLGSDGFRVATLQHLLAHRGVYAFKADGDFGPKTRAAVVAYQARQGLARDGVVGPKTWAKVVVTVRQGSRGDAVLAAQSALKARGAKISVDGIASSGTRSAIQMFQEQNQLDASGVVGAETWNRLV